MDRYKPDGNIFTLSLPAFQIVQLLLTKQGSPLQLNEKRRQDEDSLQTMLCTICMEDNLLDELFQQPSDSIRLFVKRLQSVRRVAMINNLE